MVKDLTKMRKRRLAVILICSLFLGLLPLGNEEKEISYAATGYGVGNPVTKSSGETVWDCIYFGNYPQNDASGETKEWIRWRVLSVKGNDAFLISDKNLDVKPYNKTQKNVTWETCTLRTWLNSTFLNEAFSSQEQKAILQKTISNEDNPNSECNVDGGNSTKDRVYLLSYSEAIKTSYGFTSTQNSTVKRKALNTAYVAKRSGMASAGNADEWWLRTPGQDQKCAIIVNHEKTGDIYWTGIGVHATWIAVRPVIHIDLSTFEWEPAGTISSNGTSNIPSYVKTPTPTAKPTAAPTVKPTVTPTVKPTVKPTVTPTVKPTATPTVKPTVKPTIAPTVKPTVKPTVTPTVKPTVKPTAAPTVKPTATPTMKPTVKPTVTPTVKPTTTPTMKPTVKPTATPTVKPTATPTVKPTVKPTEVPSHWLSKWYQGDVWATETEYSCFTEGEYVSLMAPENQESEYGNYRFYRWEVVSGETVIGNEYSANTFFWMPDEDVEIRAVYRYVEDSGDGGEETPEPTGSPTATPVINPTITPTEPVQTAPADTDSGGSGGDLWWQLGTMVQNMINSPAEPDYVQEESVTVPGGQQPKAGQVVIHSSGQYKIRKSTAKEKTVVLIKARNKKITSVSIPNSIQIQSDSYKVVEIAKNAFKGCKKLKKISIGNEVLKIGNNAFSGCTVLETATVGNKVTSIGNGTFQGCRKIKKILIRSKALTKIGRRAFSGVSRKATIRVPKSKVAMYRKLMKKG